MKKLLLIVGIVAVNCVAGFSQNFRSKANIAKTDTLLNGVDYTTTIYCRINYVSITAAGSEAVASITIFSSNRARLKGEGGQGISLTYPTQGWDRTLNENQIIIGLANMFNVKATAININL